MESILIVDDNKDLRFLLSNFLRKKGYLIRSVGDGATAIEEIKNSVPDLVLLDMKLPDMNGIEILQKMKTINDEILIIMITAYANIKDSIKAMKLGAYDYITKPFDYDDLMLTIQKALETQNLNKEVQSLRIRLHQDTGIDKEMGESREIKKILKQIELVAPTNLSIIIQGESGTGKEVVANIIHRKSERKDKPFIAVDCGAIPDTLVESELFGFEKGAFTGATSTKKGKFEEANGGTILLDEITNLPFDSQAKLLRAIESREIYHVGGKKPIKIDVRIIATTNLDLLEVVEEGKFRNDLYHRLNQFKIILPSLRERKEDIPLLAEEFLKEANLELKKKVKDFSPKSMKLFLDYEWPGNVRELKNVVKKAVLLTEDYHVVVPENVFLDARKTQQNMTNEIAYVEGETLQEIVSRITEEAERKIILEVLQKEKYNKTKVAKRLGIDRKTLYSKLRKLGLD